MRYRFGLLVVGVAVISLVVALGRGHLGGRGHPNHQREKPTQAKPPDEKKRAYVAAARRAIEALEDIDSLVRQGITLVEYQRRIADARIAVDRFLRAYPTDLAPPSRELIRQTIGVYESVAKGWGVAVISEAYGVKASKLRDGMQRGWALAQRAIAEADMALSEGRLEVVSHFTVLPRGQVKQELDLRATGELDRARDVGRWDFMNFITLSALVHPEDPDEPQRKDFQGAFFATSISLNRLMCPDLVRIPDTDPAGLKQIERQAKLGGWSFQRRATADGVTWRAYRSFADLERFLQEERSRLLRIAGPDRKTGTQGKKEQPTFWDYEAPLYGDVRLTARNLILVRWYAWEERLPAVQMREWPKWARGRAGPMFPTRYRVTLPGVITSTNAHSSRAATAEWYYPSLFDFERGHIFRVSSRCIDWYAFAATLAAMCLAGAAHLWRRRKRRLKLSASAT